MSFTSPGMIRPSDATRLTLYPRHIIKAGEDNMGLIASSDWHPLIISFLGSGLHGPPCSLRHDSLLGWWFLTEISWIGFPAVTTIRRKLRQKKTMRTGGKKDSHYIYPSKSFLPPVPPDDQHWARRKVITCPRLVSVLALFIRFHIPTVSTSMITAKEGKTVPIAYPLRSRRACGGAYEIIMWVKWL